jgi:D-3-phosphoglycerate dehydrogenase
MAARFRVVHADARPGQNFEREMEALGPLGAEITGTRARDRDELIANLRDADAVLLSAAPISREVIAALERCRVIVRYGVGVDTVDLDAATERGIVVAKVLDFCTEEVANHALMMILALARRLRQLDADMREGHWHRRGGSPIRTVWGETLGILGFGAIGRDLASKARVLGMRVVACDPYVEESVFREAGVTRCELLELVESSDYVSLNAPATTETHHVIGGEELARMKPSAFLINTARGALVDESALIEALRLGRIGGAGLDVFEEEPLPQDSPLRSLENVVLTPHTGGLSVESLRKVRVEVGKAAAAVLSGRWPRYVANPAVRERIELAPCEES